MSHVCQFSRCDDASVQCEPMVGSILHCLRWSGVFSLHESREHFAIFPFIIIIIKFLKWLIASTSVLREERDSQVWEMSENVVAAE